LPHHFSQGLYLAVQAAEELPAGTILNLDKNLLINLGIQWLNIIILTVVLVKLLYKPVKKYMADRSKRIHDEIESAHKLREEALELREQYEKMIQDIEQEREEILTQAHKKAVERSDQLLFDARHEADAMYSRALTELETERENITNDVKKQIVEISVLMASRFVEVSIDRETQDRYIDEALSEWEGG